MNLRHVLPCLFLLASLTAVIIRAALNRDRLDLAELDAWLSGLGLMAPIACLGLYALGTVASFQARCLRWPADYAAKSTQGAVVAAAILSQLLLIVRLRAGRFRPVAADGRHSATYL